MYSVFLNLHTYMYIATYYLSCDKSCAKLSDTKEHRLCRYHLIGVDRPWICSMTQTFHVGTPTNHCCRSSGMYWILQEEAPQIWWALISSKYVSHNCNGSDCTTVQLPLAMLSFFKFIVLPCQRGSLWIHCDQEEYFNCFCNSLVVGPVPYDLPLAVRPPPLG